MSSRIYAAEDDDNIREILRCTLESYGYEVEVFESAAPMLERMRQQLPDLVLMDIMMPEMDGMEALRRMKESAQTREVPVIFLTAKSSEVDKVRGLDLGAEDYITKPFGLLELAARVRAALRRQPAEHRQHRLTGGDLVIDLDNHEVTQSGQHLDLTLKEYELLLFLMLHLDMVFSREALYEKVWGLEAMGDNATVAVHINRLREKIERDPSKPRYIQTVWGAGYRFQSPSV